MNVKRRFFIGLSSSVQQFIYSIYITFIFYLIVVSLIFYPSMSRAVIFIFSYVRNFLICPFLLWFFFLNVFVICSTLQKGTGPLFSINTRAWPRTEYWLPWTNYCLLVIHLRIICAVPIYLLEEKINDSILLYSSSTSLSSSSSSEFCQRSILPSFFF